MSRIIKIEEGTARVVRSAMQEALSSSIGQEFGLDLQVSGVRFSRTSILATIELSVIREGVALTENVVGWMVNAPEVLPDLYEDSDAALAALKAGIKFEDRGQVFRVLGYDLGHPKYCIVAERDGAERDGADEGETFRFPLDVLQAV